MKKKLLIVTAAVLSILAACALSGGTTAFIGFLRVQSSGDSLPTCASTGSDGSICAAADIEAEADVYVGDDLTVTDDVVFGDDIDIGGSITLENDEQIINSTDDMVCIVGSGGTSDEDMCFDTDGTNVIALNSSTGVVGLDLAAVGTTLTLANDQTIVSDTDNEITFADNSEDITLEFAADSVSISSNTGVAALALSGIGYLVLENQQTIDGGTDNKITLLENSETLTMEFKTDEIELSTNSSVDHIDFGAIAARVASPMMILDHIRFCGQGANGSTTNYMGPANTEALNDDGTSYAYGSAGCDGLDNTTEATADAVFTAGFDIQIVALMCSIDDGGTDDVDYTFQLRDDAADVTGATCAITLDGAGFDVCTVLLEAPVTVAAGSAVAVSAAGTDDDCSGCDQECRAYFTLQ